MNVLWILYFVTVVSGFNVDIESRVAHHGNPGSWFGFAVQEHSERGQKWVLVGAPEDDTGRRGLEKPGAVWRCDTLGPSCSEVIFDRNGNMNDTNQQQIDEKKKQWFGATLVSTGINGPVVACAPRYVHFLSSRVNKRDPVGTCFVAEDSFTKIREFSPCRVGAQAGKLSGQELRCQAGFGAAISKDGKRLFMGAPGRWYWQGQTYSIDPQVRFRYYVPKQDGGQLISETLEPNGRPPMVSTTEDAAKFDDSYMGYSLTVGDFAGQGEQGVAVGVPRGSDLRGLVCLYTWELRNIKNISGEQMGAYFGYSLASGDIDGDGLDDVIVGAPMYTRANNEGSFEHGRVYVIYQGRSEIPYKLNHYRTGEVSRGRFGLALTSLGDINLDTYGDFAVGAPYGGKNGRGVVYIYHGSKDGVRAKPSQVITAEEVSLQLETFGFSLSGGVDLDDNLYTDLVVGAYKSDTAVFFKSRPVVKVTATVEFDTPNKLISLDRKTCRLQNGTQVVCAQVNYCLQYDGTNVDRQIAFEVSLMLDTQQNRSPRMFLMDQPRQHVWNRTISINRQQVFCDKTEVYVAEEVRDKLTPLEVSLVYNLKAERYGANIPPVLDMNAGNVQRDAISIQKNCGPDNVCIPDLKMSVTPSVEKYLLGSEDKFSLSVYIENSGEDAFEATYWLSMPRGVHFVRMERLETGHVDTNVYCTQLHTHPNVTLKCDIGNPLPSNQMVHFKVILEPEYVDGRGAYMLDSVANSTNREPEYSLADNRHHLALPLLVDARLTITAVSKPPDLHYNASEYESTDYTNITREADIGPQVVHLYQVHNEGPSPLDEAEVYLLWPYQTLAGEDLFYVVVQPEGSGNLRCEMAPHVNDRGLYIDRRDKTYLALVNQGITDEDSGLTVKTSSSFNQGTAGGRTTYTGQSASSGAGGQYLSTEAKRRIEAQQTRTMDWSRRPQPQDFTLRQGHVEGTATRNQYGAQSGSGTQQVGTRSGWSQHGAETHSQEGSYVSQGGRSQGTYAQGSASQGTYAQGSASQGSYAGSANQGTYGSQGSYQGAVNQGAYGHGATQGGYGEGGAREETYSSFASQQAGRAHGGHTQTGYGQYGANRESGGEGYSSEFHRASNPTVVRTRVYNSTTYIDRYGNARSTESSTEYATLGHEGEEHSSFSNRYGGSGVYGGQRSQSGGSQYSQSGSGQHSGGSQYSQSGSSQHGGSSQYGAGSQGAGSSQYAGGSQYGAGSQSSHSAGTQGGSGAETWQGRGWSTEETVNTALFHAGSRTAVQERAQGDVTVVGGSEDSAAPGLGEMAVNPYHEFRTNTLDLGVGGGEESAHTSGASHTSGHTSGASHTSGHTSGASHMAGASHGGAVVSSSEYSSGGYRSGASEYSGSATASRGSSYQSQSHSYGSVHGAQAQGSWRRRRQADESYGADMDEVIRNCTSNFRCALMRCFTGRMERGQDAWLAVRGRVNAKLLTQMSKERSVILSSWVGARATRLPYVGEVGAGEAARLVSAQAQTHVQPQLEGEGAGSVPLWVVVLAACAGALLLLLLVLLLYKCGFFKRNRPTSAPERQPLNGKGFHGDEHL